ncbi:hypothetical protein T440DRAFT_74646 [Plenodomus tracheiphilus IPT5]|uniref:S-adenosyl-L-methionine-dependent methyltransferase n=1 Tax=Plenodomus tracheiphilus IPT5 TaxID=1408161 RepID=A0A6A7B6K3_9PLEO|nr:hypothetical protein T440DRAFT_74646 [Plenodomus tracheiphilus IPT5]
MIPFNWIGEIVVVLSPSLLLALGMWHFIVTVLKVIFVERHPFAIFNRTELRFKSFARLWKKNGKAMSAEMPGPIFSMLENCKGVILDLGPGSGEMLKHFNPEQITALYGVEPAEDLHPRLAQNSEAVGFGTKFHALICGGEPESLIPALHKTGIMNESGKDGLASDGLFDEICCVRVLCSVPHVEQTIKNLYSLLKPGGRMVICEHVVNPWSTEGRLLARLAQIVYTLFGWSFVMGNCELQRPTYDYLRDAGEWDQFDLKYYRTKEALPFIVGELIKKGETAEESHAEAIKKGKEVDKTYAKAVEEGQPGEKSYAEAIKA